MNACRGSPWFAYSGKMKQIKVLAWRMSWGCTGSLGFVMVAHFSKWKSGVLKPSTLFILGLKDVAIEIKPCLAKLGKPWTTAASFGLSKFVLSSASVSAQALPAIRTKPLLSSQENYELRVFMWGYHQFSIFIHRATMWNIRDAHWDVHFVLQFEAFDAKVS